MDQSFLSNPGCFFFTVLFVGIFFFGSLIQIFDWCKLVPLPRDLVFKDKRKTLFKVLLCQSDGEKMNKNVCCLQYTTGCFSNTVKTGLKEPCIGQVLSLEKWK